MFKRLMPYIAIALLVLIDIAVVPIFTTSVYVIPGTLVFVICLGMLLGRSHGMLCGLLGGLLVDILSGSPMGYMTVAYVASGYLPGLVGHDTDEVRAQDGYSRPRAALRRFLAAFAMLCAFEAVTLIYQYFHTALFERAYAGNALIRAAMGALLAGALHFALAPALTDAGSPRVRIGPKREVKNL
jgi:cell shape-determining protein MreD